MRLIDADRGLISKIQRETGCNFITAQKIVDSMPTVEERKEEKWIPENIPYDNVQEKVVTQREVICGLNAMNDELQAKLDKIKQIVNEKGNMWGANVHERLKEILEQE